MGLLGIGIDAAIGFAQNQAAQADAKRQAALVNKQARQDWSYDNKIRKKTNRYNRKDWNNAVSNEIDQRTFQDRLAIKDYDYKTAQQNYEFNLANREYAQSEKNYKLQLDFNNIAAAQAYEAESRKLNEIRVGQAFQSQDLMIQNMVESGEVAARGQSGRSVGKSLQATAASYGRNIAVLAKSMESAEQQYTSNMKKINVEKLGADLQAEAARMLKPERMPSLPRPEPLPVARITKPMKIPRRKKPVAASAGSGSAAYLGTMGKLATGALDSFDFTKGSFSIT